MGTGKAVHGTAQGEAYWGPGDRYTFHVTGEQSGGAMFAFDCVVGKGGGPPPHRHLAEDELFYVYEGTLSFTADGVTREVSAGESIFVPRGTAHSYRNTGDGNVLMLTIYTPAGMEGWFREVYERVDDPTKDPPAATPEMIERMTEAGPRYNVEWVAE
ncbi:MAG TPA: cupin domain-containing protein [Solirubrobacteraceae bacterium]|nr:cupin domain-containing protein [Solirubrobacteraceae bacterium]